MAQFNISENHFASGSNMFGSYNEYNFSWSELEREADTLKAETAGDSILAPAVTELQTAIKSKKEHSVKQVIEQYAAAFSSATFANLASAGILALVNAFLH